MSQHAFFQHYMTGSEVDEEGRPRMLKVKDWPPEEHFRVRMVRHNQVRRDLAANGSPPGRAGIRVRGG